MIEMLQCKLCGRIFETSCSINLCPACKEKDDDVYSKLRNYLIEHPGAKIFEVSTTLSIPVNYIKRYLREDRLEIIEKENNFLKCEKCGSPIRSGMLCDKCLALSREKGPILNSGQNQKSSKSESLDKKESSKKINYISSDRSRRKISV